MLWQPARHGLGRKLGQLVIGLGLWNERWLLLSSRWAAAGASEQTDIV